MEEKVNVEKSEDIKMSLGTAIFITVVVAAVATTAIVWISLKIKGAI